MTVRIRQKLFSIRLHLLFLVLTSGLIFSMFAWKKQVENFKQLHQQYEVMQHRLQLLQADDRATLDLTRVSRALDQDRQLLPGWVVRVYETSKDLIIEDQQQDLGTFILDESRFGLGHHRLHGIMQPIQASYRLNSFINAQSAGTFQLGIDLEDTNPDPLHSTRCVVSLKVGQEEIIEERFGFKLANSNRHQLVGSIKLEPGLHSVESVVSCEPEKNSPQDSKQAKSGVLIAISIRKPGDSRLSSQDNAFWHAVNLKAQCELGQLTAGLPDSEPAYN